MDLRCVTLYPMTESTMSQTARTTRTARTATIAGTAVRKLATAQIALAAALVAVYPLAGALIYVMVPSGYVHGVMIYGFAYMLILPIALVDYAEDHQKAGDGLQIQAAAAWIILLTVSVTAYSYAVTDNNAYLKADLGMRQCAAYSNRMIERAESCEGYRPGMDLVLLEIGRAHV